MDVLRFMGFAVIAILVLFGVDYYQQNKKHDGTLAVDEYIATVGERLNLYKTEQVAEEAERDRKKRWRDGGKPYLPDSSEEWVRRAISDHDFTVDARLGEDQAKASDAARPLAIEVAVQEAETRARKLDRIGWVYEKKGGHAIWVQISAVQRANTNTLAGNLAQTIASINFSDTDYVPLGVIGGAAYFQAIQKEFYDVSKTARKDWAMIKKQVAETGVTVSFNTFVATIGFGEEFRLLVRSDAPVNEVYDFLGQLDYDGLNALLSLPVPGVGNDTQIDKATEAELAVEMANLRTEFVKLRGELSSMRIQNLDSLSLVANTLAGQYGLPNDAFDLTANNISSPYDLMQVGYRKGLVDLMATDTQPAAAERKGFFGTLLANAKGDGPQAQDTEQGESGSLLGSLTSIFKTSGDSQDQAAAVTVRKGGGSPACSLIGSSKRCSVGSN